MKRDAMGGADRHDTESAREQLPTEAMLALQAGRKIEAIRIVREQTGLGLAESKDLVERAERRNEPGPGSLPPGKEDSGVLRLLAVIVILGALAAAIFFL